MQTAPVVIVGAGPTGLCASILLSRHGVPSLVIERQPRTSIVPITTGISASTMELFRSWGIDPAVREGSAAGHVVAAVTSGSLVDHARRFRVAEVRFETELVDFQSYATGVDITMVDRPTGVSSHGRVSFVIASDRAAGLVRAKMGAKAADRLHAGRIFIAGEAAPRKMPVGAELNVGIHDAHNLAWKIAAVIQGWGDESLLESYDAERRPAAEWQPAAWPGNRAPQLRLGRGSRAISSFELWRERFVLLVSDSPIGGAWAACAYSVARDLEIPFAAFTIGRGGELRDPEGRWRQAFGIEADGAVLIRPDGRVAWRSRRWTSNPIGKLTVALSHILSRETIGEVLQAAS